jgi:hypothetical protein
MNNPIIKTFLKTLIFATITSVADVDGLPERGKYSITSRPLLIALFVIIFNELLPVANEFRAVFADIDLDTFCSWWCAEA